MRSCFRSKVIQVFLAAKDKALLLLKSVTTTETKRLVEAQINAKNYDGVFDTLKARFGIPKSILSGAE